MRNIWQGMSYGSLVTLRTPKVKMLNTEGTAIGVAKRTKDGVNTPVLRNAESCLNLKIVLLGREITLHLCLVETGLGRFTVVSHARSVGKRKPTYIM